MAFETINYAEKRLRQLGSKEWKLWFTEAEGGLEFRMLTKDSAGDCYETVTGLATEVERADLKIMEDENDDAYFTDHFRYGEGSDQIDIYLEIKNRELAWVHASGAYALEGCALGVNVPLMPEVAG